MKPINAVTLSGFILTAVALYILGYFPFLPVWSIFIAWACFFHLEGGEKSKQAFYATVLHIGFGALASWISALLVINSPFTGQLVNQFWAPVLIALIIAGLMRISMMTKLSVTPAIIYGYASIWAFLSVPGLLSNGTLLSFSFQNAIIAILCSTVLGASAGYINAMMVNFLCSLNGIKQDNH